MFVFKFKFFQTQKFLHLLSLSLTLRKSKHPLEFLVNLQNRPLSIHHGKGYIEVIKNTVDPKPFSTFFLFPLLQHFHFFLHYLLLRNAQLGIDSDS